MGLDVSLYHFEPSALERKLEVEAQFKLLTKGIEYKSEKWLKICDQLGTDEYGDYEAGEERIEFDSSTYPEHYFKIGYMRSSYNDSGINHILEDTIGESLYSLFGVETEEYYQHIDWAQSKARVQDALDKLREYRGINGTYSVLEVPNNLFSQPDPQINSKDAALRNFTKERQTYESRDTNFPGAYSNSLGSFFFDKPLKVVATLYGIGEERSFSNLAVRTPRGMAYLICAPDLDPYEWYEHALQIVIEMCDWVLEKNDPENYILGWSG